MAKIFNGRYTAKTGEPFVVFLIGMRINKWWRFDKWIPIFAGSLPGLVRKVSNTQGDIHRTAQIQINGFR